MLKAAERKAKIWSVVRVSSGNFLEMYDFMVFGYYVSEIGQAFFPSHNHFASLMNALMTFGGGFLMRPLGAIFLGAYLDHYGRRAGLVLTLGLMSIGTLSIAYLPGYETIGLFAPVLMVIGRLVQGLSAGVELGAVSVYLAEIATPGHKGFYVSWQSASQQAAVVFAAFLGVLLSSILSTEEMERWGWRVPLLIGCTIIPFLFVIRRSLKETDELLARKHRPAISEIFRSIRVNWPVVVIGMMLVTMTTVSFYTITALTPTFGKVLLLKPTEALIVTFCVGVSNYVLLPVMGALSDKLGRRPLLFTCTAVASATAYPALSWLVSEPSFSRLLVVQLWLSLVYAGYNGAMIDFLTEIMPAEVRTSGVLSCLQPRGGAWRLHTIRQHLHDRENGEPGVPGPLVVVRRRLWPRRSPLLARRQNALPAVEANALSAGKGNVSVEEVRG
jgi:MFS family permease